MFIILSAVMLANTSVVSHSTTRIEGEGTTYTKIQTTVNGNTTTVESNQPGTVSVEKTDTTESVTSDNPVTVTHSPSKPTPTTIAEFKPTVTETNTLIEKKSPINTQSFWKTLLHNLWDRVKRIVSFGLLTHK